EEVVAHVVFDVARGADEDPAHQEAEDAADEADGQQDRSVLEQLHPRHAAGEIVDRELQNFRRREGDRLSYDRTGQTEQECATVSGDVTEEPAKGAHLVVSIILSRCTPSTSSCRRSSFYGLLIATTALSSRSKSGPSMIRGSLQPIGNTTAPT